MNPSPDRGLPRRLNLVDAVSLVVGGVIGSAIFLVPSTVLAANPAPLAAVRGTLARTQVLERIPTSAKHTLRSWTMRPQRPGQAVVSDELRERIHDALRDDLQRLRTIVGPSFDLWGLA